MSKIHKNQSHPSTNQQQQLQTNNIKRRSETKTKQNKNEGKFLL